MFLQVNVVSSDGIIANNFILHLHNLNQSEAIQNMKSEVCIYM